MIITAEDRVAQQRETAARAPKNIRVRSYFAHGGAGVRARRSMCSASYSLDSPAINVILVVTEPRLRFLGIERDTNQCTGDGAQQYSEADPKFIGRRYEEGDNDREDDAKFREKEGCLVQLYALAMVHYRVSFNYWIGKVRAETDVFILPRILVICQHRLSAVWCSNGYRGTPGKN